MTSVSISSNLPTAVQAKRRLEEGYRVLRNTRISELLKMLVYRTPVATGEARGSWRVTGGAPAQSHEGTLDPEGAATVAKGVHALEGIHHFAHVHLSNTAPHFKFLEEGSSQQAPTGVIRVVLPAFKGMHKDVL